MVVVIAAWIYAFAAIIVVLFQLALALGAPWGHLAMGGHVKGKFTPAMRIGAVLQALLMIGMAWIVASHAGVLTQNASSLWDIGIWVVVGISGLSLVLNLITPSRPERAFGAPIASAMFVSSLIVACH